MSAGDGGSRTPQEVLALVPDLVRWRRHLHRHPEPSYHESETAAYIATELAAMGLEPRVLPGHAVTAEIGAAAGRLVAVRADIDALPVTEETGLPYASTRPGLMHACGHDGHTAILLGLARLLAEAGDLPGRVRLIFQPAEEVPPGGAAPLIAAGVLEGVGAIVGLHLWAPLASGRAVAAPGPAWASADRFRATIRGRGGHGANPHLSVDALFVACQAVVALQGIVSRRVDPLRPAVLSVGSLHAGEAFNIIAGSAVLEGTTRAFDPETRRLLQTGIDQVLHSTAAAWGAEVELEHVEGYPPLVNDPAVTAVVTAAASSVLGDGQVAAGPPEMASDDFGRYLQHVPGCYLTLGAGGRDSSAAAYPHHHPRFVIDEAVLPDAVAIVAEAVRRLLRDHG